MLLCQIFSKISVFFTQINKLCQFFFSKISVFYAQINKPVLLLMLLAVTVQLVLQLVKNIHGFVLGLSFQTRLSVILMHVPKTARS